MTWATNRELVDLLGISDIRKPHLKVADVARQLDVPLLGCLIDGDTLELLVDEGTTVKLRSSATLSLGDRKWVCALRYRALPPSST